MTPDMLLPELHVYATSQAIYGNKNRIANVEAVIIRARGEQGPVRGNPADENH